MVCLFLGIPWERHPMSFLLLKILRWLPSFSEAFISLASNNLLVYLSINIYFSNMKCFKSIYPVYHSLSLFLSLSLYIYIYIYIYIVYLGSRFSCRHILLKVTDKDLFLSFLLTFSCWQARCCNSGWRLFKNCTKISDIINWVHVLTNWIFFTNKVKYFWKNWLNCMISEKIVRKRI